MRQKLGIYILFCEKLEQTKECIESFMFYDVDIYVLNNGSSFESYANLQKFCENKNYIKIFDAGKNLGVSKGRNYLINNTDNEWMLFVDNDIIMNTKDFLNIFEEYKENYPEIEIFIPKLFNKHTNTYSHYFDMKIKSNKLVSSFVKFSLKRNNFPGGASFIKRSVFSRLGLYEEKIFVGFEDFELAIRGIKNGNPIKALIVNEIEMIHDHRIISTLEDEEIAKIRYNKDFIRKSVEIIKEKHGIIMNDNWNEWAEGELHAMLSGKRKIGFRRSLSYLYGKIIELFFMYNKFFPIFRKKNKINFLK